VVLTDRSAAASLNGDLHGLGIELLEGPEGIEDLGSPTRGGSRLDGRGWYRRFAGYLGSGRSGKDDRSRQQGNPCRRGPTRDGTRRQVGLGAVASR